MAIRRPGLPADRYTIIANAWMRDPRLSYRAKGLLAYIAGHAPGHELTMEQIIGEGREGREAIRAAIQELEDTKYLVRFQRRMGGRITGTDWELSDPGDQEPVSGADQHKCASCQVSAGGTGDQEPVSGADQAKQGVSAGGTGDQESPPKKTSTSEDQKKKMKRNVEPAGTTRLDSEDPRPEFLRDDVERLCSYLANRIEENGSKRPAVTNRWREACRLLIDKDGRTAEQVHAAIDWCQDNEFWRANILSMGKLRDRYDQLRLQAVRERARPTSGAPSGAQFKNSEEQRIERGRMERFRAQEAERFFQESNGAVSRVEAWRLAKEVPDAEILKLMTTSTAVGYSDSKVIDAEVVGTEALEVES